jgi:hypothetical protein
MDWFQWIAAPEKASIVAMKLEELHLKMVEKCYSVHQILWMKAM